MKSHELLDLGVMTLTGYPPITCLSVIEDWQKRGGQPWQLIEPVDGFHPNEVSITTWWSLSLSVWFSKICVCIWMGFFLILLYSQKDF